LFLCSLIRIFAENNEYKLYMTTTISLPINEYHRAEAYAKERNLSMDDLFISLINQLTLNEEYEKWSMPETNSSPFSLEELNARIEQGEQQFENGEYKTHEQLMAELQHEFSWLK